MMSQEARVPHASSHAAAASFLTGNQGQGFAHSSLPQQASATPPTGHRQAPGFLGTVLRDEQAGDASYASQASSYTRPTSHPGKVVASRELPRPAPSGLSTAPDMRS